MNLWKTITISPNAISEVKITACDIFRRSMLHLHAQPSGEISCTNCSESFISSSILHLVTNFNTLILDFKKHILQHMSEFLDMASVKVNLRVLEFLHTANCTRPKILRDFLRRKIEWIHQRSFNRGWFNMWDLVYNGIFDVEKICRYLRPFTKRGSNTVDYA